MLANIAGAVRTLGLEGKRGCIVQPGLRIDCDEALGSRLVHAILDRVFKDPVSLILVEDHGLRCGRTHAVVSSSRLMSHRASTALRFSS